ncbi:hypothetical protein JCM10296v2_004462 [Rhodotorula toruloides]
MLEADRSARPRRQRLGDGGLDLCDWFGTSFVYLSVRRAEHGFSPKKESYAASFFIERLPAGYVAAPPSGNSVKTGISPAFEDNSNKRKKQSTASLTPKIRRPPLYRSPPPPVHHPYASSLRAHQQPYAPRPVSQRHDASSGGHGNRRPLAILRRRSDQQACSTSLPTPPLSHFSSQSYV